MKIGTCPDPSYPAIILTFALKEVDVLQAPPHLPIDRATAVATQRSGPTVQDYDVISTFRTPLFADCDPCKKKRHQVAEHFLGTSDSAPGSRNSSPLEAVWEGMYMASPFFSLPLLFPIQLLRLPLLLRTTATLLLRAQRVKTKTTYAEHRCNVALIRHIDIDRGSQNNQKCGASNPTR